MTDSRLIFATYADSQESLRETRRLAESIRTFAGALSTSRIYVYLPAEDRPDAGGDTDGLKALDVEIGTFSTPPDARGYPYGNKVYAAAAAEAQVADRAAHLVWMDSDSVVLAPPLDFCLNPGIVLAYCPVMHNRSGSLFSGPPDPFWARIYERLEIPNELLFPMTTPADKQKIRAYFQAGLLVVRPAAGILRRWPEDFRKLHTDGTLASQCEEDRTRRIFLHQTALVGAILHNAARAEMLELSDRYNYPLFFERQYDAQNSFDSIDNVVTLRVVISSRHLVDDWSSRITGPREKVQWLRERLGS